ncbi:MAG: SDR family NAD(P)-dependent oxidoreductase [Pseudomonadota bacterium]
MTARINPRGAVMVITGGARGIGRALCEEAHQRGAQIVAVDCDSAGLDALADQLPDRVTVHDVDVTNAAAMPAVVKATMASHGRIDVVVANAGIERIEPMAQMSSSDFERVLEVNLLGVYRTLKPCIEPIVHAGGHLTAVSSLSALLPFPYGGAYGASKSAVDMLMRVLRMELMGTGATAGAAYFGFVMSDMGHRVTEHPGVSRLSRYLPKRLLGLAPYLTEEDVARRFMNGIERRRACVYAPAGVRVAHVLRGVLAPLDDVLGRYVMRLPETTRDLFGSAVSPESPDEKTAGRSSAVVKASQQKSDDEHDRAPASRPR